MGNQNNQQPTQINIVSSNSESYAHISAWGYFGYQILFALPILGTICLIICALFASNRNLRSFARSYFCKYILIVFIIILFFTVLSPVLSMWMAYMLELLQ